MSAVLNAIVQPIVVRLLRRDELRGASYHLKVFHEKGRLRSGIMETPPPLSPADVATALLSSDLAQEVRAEFEGRVSVGLPVAAATAHAFGRFRTALGDADDGPVVILALAALQWREGAVQAVIRDAAVDLIDSGEAATAYTSPDAAARRGRRDLLEAFAEVLRTTDVVADDDEG